MAKIGSGGQEKSLSLGYWALDGYFGQRQRYQELFGMPFVSTEDVKTMEKTAKMAKIIISATSKTDASIFNPNTLRDIAKFEAINL